MKMNGSILDEILRFWDCLSLLIWIGDLAMSLLLKFSLRKLELCSVKFFLLMLCFIYINLPFGFAWNTTVMFELMLLIATWIFWISYRKKLFCCTVLLFLNFLLLFRHALIFFKCLYQLFLYPGFFSCCSKIKSVKSFRLLPFL